MPLAQFIMNPDVRFDLLENPTDTNMFYLIEAYEDEAAFDAHLNTPHFSLARYGNALVCRAATGCIYEFIISC